MPDLPQPVARSGAIAVAAFLASLGTAIAHAGERHDDPATGGWSAVGWYGLVAVVALVVVLRISTRHRAGASTAPPHGQDPSGRPSAEK